MMNNVYTDGSGVDDYNCSHIGFETEQYGFHTGNGKGHFFLLYACKIPEVLGGDFCLLSAEEWDYLMKNSISGFGTARIGGVLGFVILPLSWSLPEGCTFQFHRENSYNIETWSKMEANGAVFLPAAGSYYNTVNDVGKKAEYASSTKLNDYYGSKAFSFDCSEASGWYYFDDDWYDDSHSLRLVVVK